MNQFNYVRASRKGASMTRDDIIRIAREAGWNGIYSKPLLSISLQEANFLHFASLIASHEREECAKVCENEGARVDANWASCAAAIRARNNP